MKLTRRRLFKLFGVGAGVAVVLPLAKVRLPPERTVYYKKGKVICCTNCGTPCFRLTRDVYKDDLIVQPALETIDSRLPATSKMKDGELFPDCPECGWKCISL